DALASIARSLLRPGAINLQRYRAGQGGYPYWHCELYPRDPGCETLHRHLLWTVYLNDGFSAGETEFLYQGRKVAPRTGRLVIAPAGFTHTHRGNRPEGGDKYIATSWVLFNRAEQIFGQAPAGSTPQKASAGAGGSEQTALRRGCRRRPEPRAVQAQRTPLLVTQLARGQAEARAHQLGPGTAAALALAEAGVVFLALACLPHQAEHVRGAFGVV